MKTVIQTRNRAGITLQTLLGLKCSTERLRDLVIPTDLRSVLTPRLKPGVAAVSTADVCSHRF